MSTCVTNHPEDTSTPRKSPPADMDEPATPLLDVPAFSHILTPGSSLHPTFLLIVNAVFLCLLVVLLVLAFVTSSLHFFVLILVSVGLWAVLTWFTNELKRYPPQSEDEHLHTRKQS